MQITFNVMRNPNAGLSPRLHARIPIARFVFANERLIPATGMFPVSAALLFNVSDTDWHAFSGAVLAMVIVALLAAYTAAVEPRMQIHLRFLTERSVVHFNQYGNRLRR